MWTRQKKMWIYTYVTKRKKNMYMNSCYQNINKTLTTSCGLEQASENIHHGFTVRGVAKAAELKARNRVPSSPPQLARKQYRLAVCRFTNREGEFSHKKKKSFT
ncbi:hypothetical protein Bca4012_099722 [Brassica carinata]